jgi:hypothetical protein
MTSIGQGEQAHGRVMESVNEKNFLSCVFFWKKRKMNV